MKNRSRIKATLTLGLALIFLFIADSSTFFKGPQTNSGKERYESWFGDSDGRVLYFGESYWWKGYLETNDPLGNCKEKGDLLIGRFDTLAERFLPALKIGKGKDEIWDVLVHSNGNIYWTSFTEGIGYVSSNGRKVIKFKEAGAGFNELWEGPQGNIWVTRYAYEDGGRRKDGSVVMLDQEGRILKEFQVHEGGFITCPKSLAVNPLNGRIIINSDQFPTGGSEDYKHHSFILSPTGEVLKIIRDYEIMFMSYDNLGRGWFAERVNDAWRMGVSFPSGKAKVIYLDSFSPLDFIQDIKHKGDLTVATAWSGKVYLFEERAPSIFKVSKYQIDRPTDPGKIAYTTIISENGDLYGTFNDGILVFKIER
jgi:hypothetical protein